MVQKVFIDANILFSRTLRDWVFMLREETQGSLFVVVSSQDALFEAGARLRDHYPSHGSHLITSLLDKCEKYMDEVVENYPGGKVPWIEDEGDWHVHHAATACNAHYLLTQDKGFDDTHTCYEVYSADEFFLLINEFAPQAVKKITKLQSLHWAKKDSSKTLSVALRDAKCLEFAEIVDVYLRELAREDY